MSNGIVDTSILIDYLRGRQEAVAFVTTLMLTGTATSHVMVAAELIAGARDKREQGLIESFSSNIRNRVA